MLISCAPIVNELVSNSLKHAFPDAHRGAARNGEIRSELRGNKFIMASATTGSACRRALTSVTVKRWG
jgi:two-component sensor histidine kinase